MHEWTHAFIQSFSFSTRQPAGSSDTVQLNFCSVAYSNASSSAIKVYALHTIVCSLVRSSFFLNYFILCALL